MVDDIMEFDMDTSYDPIIKIIGVGGGGSNAVEYMYTKGVSDVEFVVCNTDAMALQACSVPSKIQLGISLSQGNGAGNNPLNGEQAAIENLDDIIDSFTDNTRMIFLTAGMGGGTGTGATPVIAKAAKAKGILTVAIVTIPFRFEGPQRIMQAVQGISRLNEYVDSLLVIDNEKLKMIYGDLGLSNAFAKADDIVANAARGIAELITLPGYVNVDFEDVKTVMSDSGVAVMGAAKSQGEDRALEAIRLALESPLLDNNHINGAKEILLNIVSGDGDNEITMDEVTAITDHVLDQVGGEAQVIWGVGTNSELKENISVTIVATGFEAKSIEEIVDTPYVKDIPKPKTLITQEIKENIEKDEERNEELDTDQSDKAADELKETIPENNIKDEEQSIEPVFDTEIINKETEIEESIESNSCTLKDCEKEEKDDEACISVCSEENNIKTKEIISETNKIDVEPLENIEIEEFSELESKKTEKSESSILSPTGTSVGNKDIAKTEEKKCVVHEKVSITIEEEVIKKQKDVEKTKESVLPKKTKESSGTKSRVAGEVYYGEVVMKPEMSESLIRKIENIPAYKRRKAID